MSNYDSAEGSLFNNENHGNDPSVNESVKANASAGKPLNEVQKQLMKKFAAESSFIRGAQTQKTIAETKLISGAQTRKTSAEATYIAGSQTQKTNAETLFLQVRKLEAEAEIERLKVERLRLEAEVSRTKAEKEERDSNTALNYGKMIGSVILFLVVIYLFNR